MCVYREQQNNYNEPEQNTIDDIKRKFQMLGQCCIDTITALQKLAEQISVVIEETKEIAILEQRKKHCKNYLELKQINRRLNILKFKQGKKELTADVHKGMH